MKVKTSITLSEEFLKGLDGVAGDFKNRSAVVEEALRLFFQMRAQKLRDEKDLKILNQRADALNKEAQDVLGWQVKL